MKRIAIALAVGLITCTPTPPAHATGIPVIDIAALQQSIQQYIQMVQQLEQLRAQLEVAKQHYQAITGNRNMAGIYQEDYLASLPGTADDTLHSPGTQVSRLADAIASQASHLDEEQFEKVAEEIRSQLSASLRETAQTQALNSQIYDNAGNRFRRLSDLMNRIDSATDEKAISDLQARIAAENGLLTNELIKLQAMNALVQQRDNIRESEAIQSSFSLRSFTY